MHLQIEQPVRNYREAQATPRATQELLHLALLNRGIFAAARGEYALSTPMQASDLDEAVVQFRAALTEIAELLPPSTKAAT
jgi:glutamate-1-semialdehyde aminotransferase